MEWLEKEESRLQDYVAFWFAPMAGFTLTNVSLEPFVLIHRKRAGAKKENQEK